MAAPDDELPPPDWFADSVRVFRDEVGLWLAAVGGFLRAPRRFSAGWRSRQRRALNPLGFAATSVAISGAASALMPGYTKGLWSQISAALLPYVYYVGLGACCHPLLRALGSRQPLRATTGVTLFAGGSAGLIGFLCIELVVLIRMFGMHLPPENLVHGVSRPVAIGFALLTFGPFVYLLVALVLGFAGAHAIGRGRALLALLFGLLVTGLIMGRVHRTAGLDSLAIGTPHLVLDPMYRYTPDVWF